MTTNAAIATDPTPTRILITAKAILATPAEWCKGAIARTATGEEVDSRLPAAVSFCAFGAINRAVDIVCPEATNFYILLDACTDIMQDAGMSPTVNDMPNTTFADVHKAFDIAIALSMETPQ